MPRTRNKIHPRKEMPRYALVNSGKEAALYRPAGQHMIHKFWRQDWVLSRYDFFQNGKRVYRKASKRAGRRFDSDMVTGETVEQPNITHHGLPADQFRKITLILSTTTEDIIRQAKNIGIPTPPHVRAAPHPSKPLYIVEMSDLSKPGYSIASGMHLEHLKKIVKNTDELLRLIEEDKRKLAALGYYEDSLHPKNSAWLIRYNEKTGIGERFLWDVTNLKRR